MELGAASPAGPTSYSAHMRVADLDQFYVRMYSYYYEKGLWCWLASRVADLLCVASCCASIYRCAAVAAAAAAAAAAVAAPAADVAHASNAPL